MERRSPHFVFGSLLQDRLRLKETAATVPVFLRNDQGGIEYSPTVDLDLEYESRLRIGSFELQHIWQTGDGRWNTVVGGRYQSGEFLTQDRLDNPSAFPFFPPIFISTNGIHQQVAVDFQRLSLYGYEHWRVLDPLLLTAGLAYDDLRYPENHRSSPVSDQEAHQDQVSPKLGVIWTPAGARPCAGHSPDLWAE
jgi:outer membrane receptor protein involved in Fe transport